jgi:predicted aldo/keto reductase-like oxidoreductase
MLTRRRFLESGLGSASVFAGFSGAPEAGDSATLPVCTLGRTGLKVPVLGYGGASLARFWHNPLSYEERVALVRYAYDRGVRYFDTAGNYGESQAILGEALKERRRDVCLVTKVETTQPTMVRKAVEKSLRELQTDYLDILLIHGTPGLEQMRVAQAMKIHAELVKLQSEKIIRFIGFSAHGYFDKALALINTGEFDLCMLSYGYIPRGHNTIWGERMTKLRDECLAQAHARGMGIVAMKVLGAGWLGRWSRYVVPSLDPRRIPLLPSAAIRYVLQDKRVHVLVIGMTFTEQVDTNIGIIRRGGECTGEDQALLAEYSAKLYQSDAVKRMRVE